MGRLVRWRLQLTEFYFEVVHRAGIRRQEADALLRLATNVKNTSLLKDHIPLLAIDTHTHTHT